MIVRRWCRPNPKVRHAATRDHPDMFPLHDVLEPAERQVEDLAISRRRTFSETLFWTSRLRAAEERGLEEGSSGDQPSGGARRDRTDDLMLAKHALSQLSYGPILDERPHLLQTCRRCERPKAARPNGRRARLRGPAGQRHNKMVGLGRLELPTSRLSSARSNQLSYKPEPDAPSRHETAWGRSRRARTRPGRKRNEDGGMSRKSGLTGRLFQVFRDRGERPEAVRDE
jgi:hypothetical protein